MLEYGIDVNILSRYRKEKYIEGRLQKWNSQQINITDDISTTLEKIKIEINKLDLNKEKYQPIIDLTKGGIIRAVNKI